MALSPAEVRSKARQAKVNEIIKFIDNALVEKFKEVAPDMNKMDKLRHGFELDLLVYVDFHTLNLVKQEYMQVGWSVSTVERSVIRDYSEVKTSILIFSHL